MTGKRHGRLTSGFTMVETLLVVAITVILTGVAFVGVINYRRSSMRLELDATAKEIYIAAQNHLLSAFDEGLLGAYADESAELGKKDTTVIADKDVYYFVYGEGSNSINSPIGDGANSALGLMLPFGSVDDTVRLGGSYIIQYQPKTGRVVGVFYASPQGIGGFFGNFGAHSFTADEYTSVASLADQPDVRLDYKGAVIGYYGGETLQEGAALKRPKLKVINGDTLYAVVTNPNYNDTGYELKLLVAGVTSEASHAFSLATDEEKIEFLLDDVTQSDKHFADICPDIIPGEDIELKVVARRTDSIAKVVWSASVKTNSLYEKVDDKTDYAHISNFRHFENLDPEISGIGDTERPTQNRGPIGEEAIDLSGANQLTDLMWPKFVENVGGGDDINIYVLDTGNHSGDNALYPVNIPEVDDFEYNGQKHMMKDVAIAYASNDDLPAGLFCDVSNGATIRDLDLVNFNVMSGDSYAGALAGSMDDCAVSGVAVYNSVGEDDDSELLVSGAKSTGGLVGMAGDGCTFEYCAAAVYVVSTGGSAGGLIGETLGEVTIDKSYSGGHTIEAIYQDAEDDAGKYNVQAEVESAGGLVGKAMGTLEIAHSYSTCSAYGETVGGLIGSIEGGNISDSYATGLVKGASDDSTVGVFGGSVDSSVTLTGNHYYSIINMYDAEGKEREVSVIGAGYTYDPEEDADMIKALDEDTDTYAGTDTAEGFMNGASKAHPYDSYLKDKTDGTYPLKTIAELCDLTDADEPPKLATTHYGDWPMPEVLLINTPST